MSKLKYEIYNKGVEAEQKLYNQLDNYDNAIVGVVSDRLKSLKTEYEELKINSNVIGIDTDMHEYLNKQQRLKELPTIIADTEREKIKLIKNKEEYKDKLCKGIAAEIGEEYAAEFNENIKILSSEYNKHLTKLIELHNKMEEMEADYNAALFETINTKGVYITINKAAPINNIHLEHNIKLNLFGAK